METFLRCIDASSKPSVCPHSPGDCRDTRTPSCPGVLASCATVALFRWQLRGRLLRHQADGAGKASIPGECPSVPGPWMMWVLGLIPQSLGMAEGSELPGLQPVQLTQGPAPTAAVLGGAGEVAAVLLPNGRGAGPGWADSTGDEAGGGEAAGERADIQGVCCWRWPWRSSEHP